MKANGWKINSMGRERKYGIVELKHTKATSMKVRKMERVNSCGMMAHTMKVTL
jgi:hypothetical protein